MDDQQNSNQGSGQGSSQAQNDQSSNQNQQNSGQMQSSQAQGAQGKTGGNLSGIMEENVDVSGLVSNAGQNQQSAAFLVDEKIAPHPNTKFDEKNFLTLLAGSISLTLTEKRRIVKSIPQLSQFQIDELIKIFSEEKGKFQELEKKHADQVKELEKLHAESGVDTELKEEENLKAQKEAEEAERIKKQLGL